MTKSVALNLFLALVVVAILYMMATGFWHFAQDAVHPLNNMNAHK